MTEIAQPADPVRKPAADIPHWTGMGERGLYAGLWTMRLCYQLLGRIGFGLLLLPVMAYFFAIGGTARRASRQFLARVWLHPDGRAAQSRQPGLGDSFRHYLSFGGAILDKIAAWSGDFQLKDIRYDNREVFARLERTGQGGIILSSHLGNVEICRALGSVHRGLKINVLVHTVHAESFNRLLMRTNPDAGLNLIQVSEFGVDTAIMLRERVARGELVVIVGDRTPPGRSARTLRVPFLGAEAPFPEGPFILASLLDCPVLLMFCLREGDGFRMIFEEFAADRLVLPREDRREHLRASIARYAARLEHHAVRYPLQWFNFFDFWASPPAAGEGSRLGMRGEANRTGTEQ